ncbi:hypothetical protein [Bacillus cereus]|uniref:Uncharacterized protein n=1 Tax=Bacillus cereus TaxID=1396 RepID=A0A9X6VMA1_BACCE|nr:hypothetical protein [Bacillus cereus]PFC15086.1 hypothetical protein CN284_00210 [Bacillus cereus]PFD22659.1 hypothetical protein CN263_09095 [Bacillus cereus]
MERIKFYSEHDGTCGMNLTKIIKLINDFDDDFVESNINVILEYYNIIKFYDVENFKGVLKTETEGKVDVVIKALKSIIGKFIDCYKEDNFLILYENADTFYKEDFWSLVESYGVYKFINEDDFEQCLSNSEIYYPVLLQFRKTVNKFHENLRTYILQDKKGAEILLRSYIYKGDAKRQTTYLPPSLTEEDKEKILLNYIESDDPHVNYLEMIINFPSKSDLKIGDRIKVKARRRYKKEGEKIFEDNNGIKMEMGVAIKYPKDQEEAVEYSMNGTLVECSVSRNWIENNLDFNTLWNNFIYIFDFFDWQMRLKLVSKIKEIGVFEKIIGNNFKHLYKTSSAFKRKDMMSTLQMKSYVEILNSYQIRLEEMIEWFFNQYLSKEFGINNFIVRMPTTVSSDFEKCRAILPEIDSILKQYKLYLEDGEIDQELLQVSSSHMFFKDCASYNNKKYVYPVEGSTFNIASNLLFSDQSMIFYLPKFDEKYNSFYHLVREQKVKLSDFQQYQIESITWLITNQYLCEDEEGYLKFVNHTKISVFADLYYNEASSYWNLSSKERAEIEALIKEGVLTIDNKLFTKNEQDYLDYHLNKATFSNSLDLRNRYLHGTQTNDDELHSLNYLIFLKLIVIIIIKINDDLCIGQFSK